MGRTSQSLKYGMQQALETPTTQTEKQYKRQLGKFVDYCKTELGITQMRHIEGREQPVIQGYSDSLQAAGYSPATVHTYLASPCKALGVPMDSIDKPKRTADVIRRSRHIAGENERGFREEKLPKFERLVSFAEAVGIRRAEYGALRGGDLVRDEGGALCVYVRSGKGGRPQLQRILPENEKTVLAAFRGVQTGEYLFSKKELNNDIDLHSKRAQSAQRAYNHYVETYSTPESRDQLRSELLARWDAYHKPNSHQREKFVRSMRDGSYITRGTVREVAEANGHTGIYDRLAVVATSVFHLAHWRAEVTIVNYLIN